MVRTSWVLAAALAIAGFTGLAEADSLTPVNTSVNYATNVDTFKVTTDGQTPFGVSSWAESVQNGSTSWIVQAAALPGSYSDAGIVLGFDGSLTLGQLQSVAVNIAAGSNTTPTINLWLDTGHDGSFFSFDGSGNLTGLNGDAYFGAAAGNVDLSTSFSALGGPVSGAFTLSDLQNGLESGIDGNTKVALWIGVTNGGDYSTGNYAVINSIDFNTTGIGGTGTPAAPLPASVWSGMTLLAGMGIYAGIKRTQMRLA